MRNLTMLVKMIKFIHKNLVYSKFQYIMTLWKKIFQNWNSNVEDFT